MRGARGRHRLVHAAEGIIPAYAGSTKAKRAAQRLARDHPRICGEHLWVRYAL